MHIQIQNLYSCIRFWLRDMKINIISWSQRIEVKAWGCSRIETGRLGFVEWILKFPKYKPSTYRIGYQGEIKYEFSWDSSITE